MDASIETNETNAYRFRLLNRITQVPMSIMAKDGAITPAFPFDECGVRFALSPSVIAQLQYQAEQTPFFGTDDHSVVYSILPLDDTCSAYLFVGPVRISRSMDPVAYHPRSFLFRELALTDCEAIFPLMPIMNLFDFFNILQLLYYETRNIVLSPEQFLTSSENLSTIGNTNSILFMRREASVYHHSYIGELQMCEIIRNGQVERLAEGMRFAEKGVPGTIHPDPLRNAKDLGIITITILARPAIQGGLSDELAYAMSDAYMQEIEACSDQKDVYAICFRAGTEYTREVAKLKKTSRYSSRMVQCIEYIQKHLHEKLSLDEIANHLHISQKQLTTLFKKETTRTISEYVLAERIDEAKGLLSFTELDYSEISSYLGFCSQSYFTYTFRKSMGTTPAEYRRKHFLMPASDLQGSMADYLAKINRLETK